MPSGHRSALTEAAAETSQQKQSTGLFLLPFLRLLTLKDLGALPQTPQLLKKLAKLLSASRMYSIFIVSTGEEDLS